jgi:hypothetical protein
MTVYCLNAREPKYLTKGLSPLLLVGFLHLVEEPVDVVVLLNEVLGESAEPIEDAEAEYDDHYAEDVNHVHLPITTGGELWIIMFAKKGARDTITLFVVDTDLKPVHLATHS